MCFLLGRPIFRCYVSFREGNWFFGVLLPTKTIVFFLGCLKQQNYTHHNYPRKDLYLVPQGFNKAHILGNFWCSWPRAIFNLNLSPHLSVGFCQELQHAMCLETGKVLKRIGNGFRWLEFFLGKPLKIDSLKLKSWWFGRWLFLFQGGPVFSASKPLMSFRAVVWSDLCFFWEKDVPSF